jgi:hypothetical protein
MLGTKDGWKAKVQQVTLKNVIPELKRCRFSERTGDSAQLLSPDIQYGGILTNPTLNLYYGIVDEVISLSFNHVIRPTEHPTSKLYASKRARFSQRLYGEPLQPEQFGAASNPFTSATTIAVVWSLKSPTTAPAVRDHLFPSALQRE